MLQCPTICQYYSDKSGYLERRFMFRILGYSFLFLFISTVLLLSTVSIFFITSLKASFMNVRNFAGVLQCKYEYHYVQAELALALCMQQVAIIVQSS